MSRTIDYNLPANLPASIGGGKLLNFNYSRNLGELIGTWSAEVAGGSFRAGGAFSIDGLMTNGLIEQVWKDPDGKWHLTGKDAGIYLMRSTPPASRIAKGNTNDVISDLASYCGIGRSITGVGLGGFNARSAVSGSTCAEAILEMAMLGGQIAYIGNDGRLYVRPPNTSQYIPPTPTLDYSGSQLDMEGYATQVAVTVTRRKKTIKEERADVPEDQTKYKGTTHDGTLTEKWDSGIFNYTDKNGDKIHGEYYARWYEPIKALIETTSKITRGEGADAVTVTTTEEHPYVKDTHTRNKAVWRGDQQYRLFAWIDPGYTITKTVDGAYEDKEGNRVPFHEETKETMTRKFTAFNVPWINDDWKDQLSAIQHEVLTRKTTRTGNKGTPDDKMPQYDCPGEYDMTLSREFKRMDGGREIICLETEMQYESRQIGQISQVTRRDGTTAPYTPKTIWAGTRYLSLPTHSMPVWVPIKTYRTTYEKYKNDGTCEISTKTEWCDEGTEWIVQNIEKTGDQEIDALQEDYAKFTQKTSGLTVKVGEGGSAQNEWQFMELPGKVKVSADNNDENYAVNSEDWYYNGDYLPSKICPHYEEQGNKCGIYGIAVINDIDGDACPHHGRGWRYCIRAIAALEQARYEQDRPLLEPPVIGIANTSGNWFNGEDGFTKEDRPTAGYHREFYIDDTDLTEDDAKGIAKRAAKNILSVKRRKGYRETVVLLYSPEIIPDGAVASVSHDLFNMQTTVSYFADGPIPDFAVPSSAAGISDGISGRNAGRRTRPMSGTITAIDSKGVVTVNVNGMEYPCTTKLVSLNVGDAVLVSFSSGNSMHGHIIERM